MLSLADENGVVRITTDALARYVNVSHDAAKQAVQRLMAIDEDSTSPAEGGRRIVPWGDGQNTYRVVNYKTYFEKSRNAERTEYKRKWDRQNADSRFNRKTGKGSPTKSDKSDPENENENENETKSIKSIPPEILDDIDLLLLDFKNLTGVTFTKKGHLKYIAPRLKEGRSIADLRLILLHKVQEWKETDFEKYLTPESLYRPSKIDTKLSMALAWDEKGRPYQGKNGATEDQKKERLFQDLGFTQDEIHPV